MFRRLANLWRGFLSLWISDIEKEHPEIAYENAINSMVAKYSKLKTATAGIIRRREDLDERYKRATTELAQTESELDTAVSTNQDDLAVILIIRRTSWPWVAELNTEMERHSRRARRRPRCSACVETVNCRASRFDAGQDARRRRGSRCGSSTACGRREVKALDTCASTSRRRCRCELARAVLVLAASRSRRSATNRRRQAKSTRRADGQKGRPAESPAQNK